MRILALALVVSCFTVLPTSAYIEYLEGTMTLPGCDYFQPAKDCKIKIEKHGPPAPGQEIQNGVVAIDPSTTTSLGGSLFIALPQNSEQWSNVNMTILSVYFTNDGTACPTPGQ